MKTKLSGIITKIEESQLFGNFEKRIFWLKQPDSEKYPNEWSLECWQGDANFLDNVSVGQKVECEIEIRGKRFTTRTGGTFVANTLKCWKITTQGAAVQPSERQQTGGISRKEVAANPKGGYSQINPEDDLPF